MLPPRFYAHFSPGVESVLGSAYQLDHHGEHLKMALLHRSEVDTYDCADTCALGTDDVDEIVEFYKQCYPGNWFNPMMLKTDQYFGIPVYVYPV